MKIVSRNHSKGGSELHGGGLSSRGLGELALLPDVWPVVFKRDDWRFQKCMWKYDTSKVMGHDGFDSSLD